MLASVTQWLASDCLEEHATIQSVIERYLEEASIIEHWFTDGVIKYHRRIGTWVTAVAQAGMSSIDVSEPAPVDPATNAQGIVLRQPVLAISARKPRT